MEVKQRSQSEESFDSSIELNSLADSESTASLPQPELTRAAVQSSKADDFFSFSQTPDKKSSFNMKKDAEPEIFIGFKQGWGGKQVKINESKLKKAKMFFDDSPELEEK